MRSYRQYCGLARTLDVIGERWVLLIVRELVEGPRRYAELRDGLPGIATNLLVERLRSMESSGVVERRVDGRYALTAWGEGLSDVIYAIGRWGSPLMAKPFGNEEFRSHWIRHMVVVRFDGVDPRRGNLVVEARCGDEPMTLISAGGRVHVVRGQVDHPDLIVEGRVDGVVGVIAGSITPADAIARGVSITGDAGKLRRLRPRPPVTARAGDPGRRSGASGTASGAAGR